MKDLLRELDERRVKRDREGELRLYGELGDQCNGVFWVNLPSQRPGPLTPLRVIAAAGEGWDHVSVSYGLLARTPSWEDMEAVKRLFFKRDEVCMQLHVPESDHISFHDHCLHIWRPLQTPIPRPPGWMVGPEARSVSKAR